MAKPKSKRLLDLPVQLGQSYKITIHGLGSSGEGIGRYEGFTVFVPKALPGELVEARITKLKKQYAIGELTQILEPSPHRRTPPCSIAEDCGGCQLQHLTYEAQLKVKEQSVRDVLTRIGGLENPLVRPIKGQDVPFHYRNKMQLPVGGTTASAVLGFYSAGTHSIIAMDDCLLQDERNNRIAQAIPKLIAETGTLPYDESTHHGDLRHVIGRVGKGGVMVVLVTTKGSLHQEKRWIEGLLAAEPSIVSIYINKNDKKTNVILGPSNRCIYGDAHLEDNIGELRFSLAPQAFFQVNPEQTVVLYEQALAYAALTGKETVIDAYCGTGTISLFLARQAQSVTGIEIVKAAIDNAKDNAAANGITNANFIAGDTTVIMPKLFEEGLRPDVVVLDPARAGCEVPGLDAILAMQPKRIVYVSCNPASQARDIKHLIAGGYRFVECTPVDLFPHTVHAEAVALLVRE